ncbi:hypothetical protein [Pseudomonas fluorescens]|uniref:hypothetical protein n=1 Tax=Pseudomonas fluorescens TaxID=294 RepID=UPI00372D79FD
MNDRELVEMAAKAAGVHGRWGDIVHVGEDKVDLTDLFFVDDDENGAVWNPLDDNGAALWLAVKLAIEISPCPYTDSVICEPKGNPNSTITVEALDEYGTRRAIVRAAAEMGVVAP